MLPRPHCSPHSPSVSRRAPSSCSLSRTRTPLADVFSLLPYPTPPADTVGHIFLSTCDKIIPLSLTRYEFTLSTFFRHLQQLLFCCGFFFFYIKPAFNSAPKDLVLPCIQVLLCKKGINTELCIPGFFITQVTCYPTGHPPRRHLPPLRWPQNTCGTSASNSACCQHPNLTPSPCNLQ